MNHIFQQLQLQIKFWQEWSGFDITLYCFKISDFTIHIHAIQIAFWPHSQFINPASYICILLCTCTCITLQCSCAQGPQCNLNHFWVSDMTLKCSDIQPWQPHNSTGFTMLPWKHSWKERSGSCQIALSLLCNHMAVHLFLWTANMCAMLIRQLFLSASNKNRWTCHLGRLSRNRTRYRGFQTKSDYIKY